MWKVSLVRSALLVALLAVSAQAGTITLFNTGVDSSGDVLSAGSADAHWSIVTVPAGSSFSTPADAIAQQPHSAWLANDATGSAGSAWIGTTTSGAANVAPGRYIFETTFDLTGFQASTAVITGRMAADNIVSRVFLNGTDLGLNVEGFAAFGSTFTINSGFSSGLNTLTFWQENAGLTPTTNWFNPSGLRVELDGTAQLVPLPPAAWMGLGLLLVLAGAQWVKRKADYRTALASGPASRSPAGTEADQRS